MVQTVIVAAPAEGAISWPIRRAEAWLSDRALWQGAVENNYEVGVQFFSYGVAAEVLASAIDEVASGEVGTQGIRST